MARFDGDELAHDRSVGVQVAEAVGGEHAEKLAGFILIGDVAEHHRSNQIARQRRERGHNPLWLASPLVDGLRWLEAISDVQEGQLGVIGGSLVREDWHTFLINRWIIRRTGVDLHRVEYSILTSSVLC